MSVDIDRLQSEIEAWKRYEWRGDFERTNFILNMALEAAKELRTLRAMRDKVEAAPHGWQFVADDGSLGVIATSHHPPFPDSYYRKVKLVPVEDVK